MPPTGVLMSTCVSCPFFSFFTLMLHADSNRIATIRNATSAISYLVLPIACSLLGNLHRTFQPSTALSDVGNRDRKMATNRNFSEERFHCRHLGDRRVGK